MMMQDSVKVAVAQMGAVIMNKEKCVEKVVGLIKEAGKNGAELVVFPEASIPCYPKGMSFGSVVGIRTLEGRKDYQRYVDNAVAVPGPETDLIGKAAKAAGVYVVIGVIERDTETSGGTVFCTALFFSPEGELLGKHRKLKPTASERYIWGEGDGSTMPVFDTPFGKMGALICWENYMPLARAAMYAKGIQIYIAPTADGRDTWFSTMRHIAVEGRCFVIGCNQYYTKADYPEDISSRESFDELPEVLSRGGSCVVSPMGEFLVEPYMEGEKILYTELDLKQIEQGQLDFDVVGHYTRPDVFKLIVNTHKKQTVEFE